MLTDLEKIRRQLYQIRRDILLSYGEKNGLIKSYDRDLIEKARHIRFGLIPLSLLLLDKTLTKGYCYSRASLLTLCFKDDNFRVVTASIDDLKFNPVYAEMYRKGDAPIEIFNHCFVERTMEDGSVWVYDTSLGAVYEKSLYYMIERPLIVEEKNKEQTLEYLKAAFKSNRKKQNYDTIKRVVNLLDSNLSPLRNSYRFILEEDLLSLKKRFNFPEFNKREKPKKLILTRNEDD